MYRRITLSLASVLGAILVLSVLGCDHTYKLQLPSEQFKMFRLVSTYPGYINNGSMVPVCSMDDPLAVDPKTKQRVQANGYILNFVLELQGKNKGQTYNLSQNEAFPGDIIKQKGVLGGNAAYLVNVGEGTNMGVSRFNLRVNCLESITSNRLNTQCSGLSNPANNQTAADFNSFFKCETAQTSAGTTERKCEHHTSKNDVGVVVMFDNSGSMEGWVDPTTYQEVGKTGGSLTGSENRATDNNWNARDQAWETLQEYLDPNYKRLVLRFGEFAGTQGDMLLLSACPNPNGLPQEKLWDQCFGINQSLTDMSILHSVPQGMGNSTKGRTPLWYSVKRVYEYLKTRTDIKVKHMIIVDDSPDTCTKKSPFYNWSIPAECSTVGFQDFKNELLQDLKANPQQNLHISFIQIQSKGYMERDPEQAEIACLTRGHYIFLNARQWGGSLDDYKANLSNALMQAMKTLAYAIQGYWQYGFDLVGLKDPATIPPGSLAAATGDLTLQGGQEDSLSTSDELLHFIIGTTTTEYNNPLADNRAVIRIPCTSGTKCTKATSNMDAPANFLDQACIKDPPQCVPALGLCHWEYAGKNAACGGNKKCCKGKCQDKVCK